MVLLRTFIKGKKVANRATFFFVFRLFYDKMIKSVKKLGVSNIFVITTLENTLFFELALSLRRREKYLM